MFFISKYFISNSLFILNLRRCTLINLVKNCSNKSQNELQTKHLIESKLSKNIDSKIIQADLVKKSADSSTLLYLRKLSSKNFLLKFILKRPM